MDCCSLGLWPRVSTPPRQALQLPPGALRWLIPLSFAHPQAPGEGLPVPLHVHPIACLPFLTHCSWAEQRMPWRYNVLVGARLHLLLMKLCMCVCP